MSWFADLPVQRKMGIAMLATSTIALVLACGVFLEVEYAGYKRSIVHNVMTLAQISADNSTAAIAFVDKNGAKQNLEALHAEPQIITATLYDASGQLFARYSSRPDEILPENPSAPPGVRFENGYVIAVQPVVEGSRRLGTLYLQATMEQIYARMQTYSLIVLGVLAASFALAGALATILRRTLARPILELASTAGAVSTNQDYSLRARQYGRDELGQLTATFNAMLEKTQSAVDGLRESEWAHRELVRALPTAAYMCDANGLISIYNDAAVALWGRTPHVGRESWSGAHRIFRSDGTLLPVNQYPIAVALREGRPAHGEEIIVERPDGTTRDVLAHPVPIRGTDGKLVGIVNMLVDITERKKADAAVRQLAAIVEFSEDAIIGKDLDGFIVSWNRGAELLYGYTAAEIIGRSVSVLIPPENVNEEPGILERIRRGEPIQHYETIRVRKDGTQIHVALAVSPIKDTTGKIVGASKIARDITERKRAEQQADFIGRITQQLTALTEPGEIIRFASRSLGEHLQVDRCYFCEIGPGATRVSVTADWGREGFPSVAGEHRAADFGTPEMWQAMAAGPLAIHDKSTHPLTRNLGVGYDLLRISAHATVPFVADGKWIASLAITSEHPRVWRKDEIGLVENVLGRVWPMIERAVSQEKLRESEHRQRELLTALPVPCYVVDENGKLTLFNNAAAKLWGREPGLGKIYWHEIVELNTATGDPLDPDATSVSIALREKKPVRGSESFVVRADGTTRWIVNHPDPITDAQGTITGVVNVVTDVTDERTAHEKVQKVAERLSLAISAAQLGDWNWDAATDIITLSPRTGEIYGVPVDKKFTRTHLRNLLHRDDREAARAALQTAMEKRIDYDVEYRVERSDGSLRWVAAKGRSFYGNDGRPAGMVGVVQDITERKQQAEALTALANKIENQARLFDATLSNLTDHAYAFDREGRFIFANKPLLELWGRRLDEIVGKNSFELGYPPELAKRVQEQVREAIATKRAVRGETSFTDARGKVDDHEYIYNPVIAPDGSVSAVVGSTRIITERKRAEETLRQSEAQLRLVTDNAPVLLVRIDLRHRYTFVNRAYAERNGFKPADMIGLKLEDALGSAAYNSVKAQMNHGLAGKRVEFEKEVPYEKLGHRWIHVIYVPESDAHGTITGILGVITDIGARKQAENELKRARDEAVAASRAKDDFLAALSHELRTPLNPVLLLASDAANDARLSPEIRANFDLILKNVNLEARLIDDLLDLTRITRGKLHLDQHGYTLHAILRDALANVEGELQAKQLNLEVKLSAADSRVLGDSVRLQQIFWNILKNAVKFTPEGGRILVSTEVLPGQNQVRLQVTDSGIGMTDDEISRIFLAFTQGDHAISGIGSHRFGGLGLGLAITKMLVDLHGGKIQAFSKGRDQGSTFQVDLPLASEDFPDRPVTGSLISYSTAPFANAVLPDKSPSARRILLVEDHAPTRQTLLHLLRQRKFEVTAADSAESALKIMQTTDFDLVISDVGLPDQNGYELMAALRALKPDLPGIALSGYGMEDDLARSRAAGFQTHLVKPVTIGMLEDAIANIPSVATNRNANSLSS
ncbi:MAG TPA: PAS domain S-box protein [Lacunisphaera sp.]|jgi:PAS domain S-box-containing protein